MEKQNNDNPTTLFALFMGQIYAAILFNVSRSLTVSYLFCGSAISYTNSTARYKK